MLSCKKMTNNAEAARGLWFYKRDTYFDCETSNRRTQIQELGQIGAIGLQLGLGKIHKPLCGLRC